MNTTEKAIRKKFASNPWIAFNTVVTRPIAAPGWIRSRNRSTPTSWPNNAAISVKISSRRVW